MALTQTEFRGRSAGALNAAEFNHDTDTGWTQRLGSSFRVRFAISGSGTVAGAIQFATDGSTYANVTDTSATVQAASTEDFTDDASTTALLSATSGFVAGSADCDDGVVGAVTLTDQHTELEYSLQLVPSDLSNGGTITLRVAGLDTYARTPAITVSMSDLDRVRLKIGDTDSGAYKLTDEQVGAYLTEWPANVDLAAANAAEAIAALYSDGYTFSSDGQTFNRSERVNHYSYLADRLRKRAGTYAFPRA